MATLILIFIFIFFFLTILTLQVESDGTIVCNTETTSFKFCDKTLPYDVRVKDLLDQMTLEEKIAQLGDRAVGVKRLNLPPYDWWSEALHGVSDVGTGTHFDSTTSAATSFPTVILSAASFNESLWKSIAVAISNEARALYNIGLSGLTFWSPNINIARDPRWGRITETPGEDPFVVGRYAVNYVKGMQDIEGYEIEHTSDPNTRPLKVAACCKHYAAYDVDNWMGVDRFHFDAMVTKRDMIETFLYPFEVCVKEGDVASIMCSYNNVNGVPTCGNPELLSQTVRGLWDLHGYIVADCGSIEVMQKYHKYLNASPAETVAQALNAGVDLDCGGYYQVYGTEAVNTGKVSVSEIDRSLGYLYTVLMRLGWFDGSPGNYNGLGKNDVCSSENLELAAEAARQGIVLLKNDNGVLPLDSNGATPYVAVVGPHANATVAMIGNYALKTGVTCRYSTPLDGIRSYTKVTYAPGCLDVKCTDNSGIPAAVEVSKGAKLTLVLVGLDLSIEQEGVDRVDLKFPPNQELLINSIVDATSGLVVLVILSAGGIDVSAWKNNPKISAIVWAGYPGAEGGRAIADVLFGMYNPAGRLPITWYPADYVANFPMTSMQLRAVPEMLYPGRTYKFYQGTTVYPFGYGLSYTNFTYNIMSAPQTVSFELQKYQQCKPVTFSNGSVPECQAILVEETKCEKNMVNIVVEVSNSGRRYGADVVMVYSVPPPYVPEAPIKRLVGFRRVVIESGEKVQVVFELSACKSFSIVDYEANEMLPSGEHSIVVGDGEQAVSTKISLNFDNGMRYDGSSATQASLRNVPFRVFCPLLLAPLCLFILLLIK